MELEFLTIQELIDLLISLKPNQFTNLSTNEVYQYAVSRRPIELVLMVKQELEKSNLKVTIPSRDLKPLAY